MSKPRDTYEPSTQPRPEPPGRSRFSPIGDVVLRTDYNEDWSTAQIHVLAAPQYARVSLEILAGEYGLQVRRDTISFGTLEPVHYRVVDWDGSACALIIEKVSR